jgi:hypothetical protein
MMDLLYLEMKETSMRAHTKNRAGTAKGAPQRRVYAPQRRFACAF